MSQSKKPGSESREFLQIVVDAAGRGLLLVDRQGGIMLANNLARELLNTREGVQVNEAVPADFDKMAACDPEEAIVRTVNLNDGWRIARVPPRINPGTARRMRTGRAKATAGTQFLLTGLPAHRLTGFPAHRRASCSQHADGPSSRRIPRGNPGRGLSA